MPKIPVALREHLPLLFGLLSATVAAATWATRDRPSQAPPARGDVALAPLACDAKAPAQTPAPAARGNPLARAAAQRGLGFLTAAAKQWTEQNRCFGCHVQAVTMEALAVGQHHQYDIAAADLDGMVGALKLGVTAGGRVTGAAFQGQAWARYDAWVSDRHSNELLGYAAELVTLQHEDGSVPDDDARLPITGGTMQTTYQSMQTWRQTFARTADDKWLTPMRKAERFLAERAQTWPKDQGDAVYLQDINFALLGLIAAGVGPGEAAAAQLQRALLVRQRADGGWGLGEASDALATGQTLYALRLAGHGDGEPAMDRGIAWLVQHQGKDGAWRSLISGQGGADKGEAMWAVLGLVGIDVTSVAVRGLTDGQRVAKTMHFDISARDNQAGGVAKLELFVDDSRIAGACGDALAHRWDTAGLSDGAHVIDVVATNVQGQVSRRRFRVYAGDTYLAELGTRFDETKQATEIAVRNLAAGDELVGSAVELAVYAVTGASNDRGAKVFSARKAAAAGAMGFAWDGVGSDGKPQPRGRYLAELTFHDGRGATRQRMETLFLQDSEAVQRATYGEIEGQLGLAGGAASTSADTELELVDQVGNVVQRVRSTEQGNFRFKNVAKGQYKVRASKRGWGKHELDVSAAPAAKPSKADFTMQRK